MIIWQGEVQVRIERTNPTTGIHESYWFDTLQKGTCLSVFNCFTSNSKSVINLYAATPCTILFIKASDLEDLGKEIIALKDRLDIIKLRIKNRQVDDIDYFTFPKRLLQSEIEKLTEPKIALFLSNYKKSKKKLLQAILNFANLYKKGLCKFPDAINLLDLIWHDKKQIKRQTKESKSR